MNKLYQRAKDGKVLEWEYWVQDNVIYVEHGQMDGKKQITQVTCEAKNIGKSNETTPHEQALLEGASLYDAKKRLGYVDDVANLRDAVAVRPMLAHKFDAKRARWPVYVQPKLDGLRCQCYVEDGQIKFLSRGNKFYNLPHIENEIRNNISEAEFWNGNIILDGELYLHGTSLQTINSWVKKQQEQTKLIQYCVYDVAVLNKPKMVFGARNHLISILIQPGKMKLLKTVSTFLIANEDQLKQYHSNFVSFGFEGTIVRNANGVYEFGYRSYDLLKYKDFEDGEYEVIGWVEGKGRLQGTVIWICATSDGKKFKVTPRGTLESRAQMWKDRLDYLGRKLTIRFIGKTDDGIPKFAVGVAFRLKEDMP